MCENRRQTFAVDEHMFESLGVNLQESRNLDRLSESPKKDVIVFCNTGWFIGGVERVMLMLVEALKEKYCMIMVSVTDSADHGYDIPKDLPFFAFAGFEKEDFVGRLSRLCCLLGTKVFVGHANIKDPFMVAFGALKEKGIRTVILNHYNYLLPYRIEGGLSVSEYRQQAFAQADVILWLNSFDAAICGLRWSHVGAMSNPIVIDKAYPREFPREKKILAVARFNDLNKRIDRMLDIFAGIYQMEPQAKLILVGPYDLNICLPNRNDVSIKAYIESLGLPEDAISFEGVQKDVKPYYLDAAMLLVTSESEGFGMVLSEAGKYGLPAIVYEYDGQEIICDGYNGFVAKPDDVKTAVEAGIRLLREPDLWQMMSKNAEESVQKYSMERVADRWDKLFTELIRGKGNTGMNGIHAAGIEPVIDSQMYRRIAEAEDQTLRILNQKEVKRIEDEKIARREATLTRRIRRKIKRAWMLVSGMNKEK